MNPGKRENFDLDLGYLEEDAVANDGWAQKEGARKGQGRIVKLVGQFSRHAYELALQAATSTVCRACDRNPLCSFVRQRNLRSPYDLLCAYEYAIHPKLHLLRLCHEFGVGFLGQHHSVPGFHRSAGSVWMPPALRGMRC